MDFLTLTDPTYFFPQFNRHPYYIVTPSYTRRSAGVSALHFLCHALNAVGQNAFIFFDQRAYPRSPNVNPEFLTPVLTQGIIDFHFEKQCCPVVIYPEIVSGNPASAPAVVRYVLNFPGLLGGDKHYDAEELCFGYSRTLARAARAPDENVLFIPVSDTRIFHPNYPKVPRAVACFHAKKYKNLEVNPVFCHPKSAIEIMDDMSREEIASIFNRSDLFYCYENSALALEAALCNCPTLFVKNRFFTDTIVDSEFGQDGWTCSNEPADIERARLSVSKVFTQYIESQKTFWQQLERFIAITRQHAAKRSYTAPISIRSLANVEQPGKYELFFRKFSKLSPW